MRRFIYTLILFFLIIAIVLVHAFMMLDFGKDAELIGDKTIAFAQNDEWDKAESELLKLFDLWDKKRLWVSLTIKTNVSEEIEISLKQSLCAARLKDKSLFLNEFIMLKELLSHIPHQEGFHIEEIL